MCGIFGIRGKLDDALFHRMDQSIVHRGPDSGGLHVDRESGVAIGIRRLRIIDLALGEQPIHNEDGTVHVVFNGEIYNYLELRTLLEKKGHRFYTRSDTETIVHLYEEYGTACVHMLRGMFGFALWDTRQRRLLLARDRLGVKPLYYWQGAGGQLVFASEIKAILEHPAVPRAVDEEAFLSYLALQYVPHPRTMFAGITKLPPGHILTADATGVTVERYWAPVFADVSRTLSDDVVAGECERLLQESISLRMIADVPVGALLSGGVDSSLIVALMARASSGRIRTFTVGFEEGGGYSELSEARRVAEWLGTEHHEEILKPVQVEALLPRLIWHLDEPIADQATIPTYLICGVAAKQVRVVLTGEGGDEIFGGYPRYAWFRLGDTLRRRVPAFAALVAAGLRTLPTGPELRRKAELLLGVLPDSERHLRWVGMFRGADFAGVRGPALLGAIPGDPASDRVKRVLEASGTDPVHRLMALDLDGWFPDNILAKVDKMSMAHSLEAREPLLDHRLVEVLGTIPSRFKVRGLKTKVLLKLVAERLLPPAVVHRRKHPFRVPIGPWLRGPLYGLSQDLLAPEVLRRDGYFDAENVASLLRAHREGRRVAGKVDYARLVDPVSLRKIKQTPGLTGTDFYQSVIIAVWVNNEKKPLNDPRVRRALHLALDRHSLVEVVRDVSPALLGGFIYPFSEFATPVDTLVERLGYQRDTKASIKEARQLLAAAGYPNGFKLDFLVRDSPNLKLWGVAIQAMLKEALNVEANIRMVQISVWFDEAQAGTFDLTMSAIVSTLLDPSDYFNAWYGKGAPQNYSRWYNKDFQALVEQIDRELDEAKRKALVRQAEAILEQDPPLLPNSWEKINDAWYTYVKGHNPTNYFGLYDVVRCDTIWLDK